MKTRWIAAALGGLLVGLLPLPAGGMLVTHEDVVKQMVKSFDRMGTALAAVQDEDTARAARPELRGAADSFRAAHKKADELPPPERAEKDRLAKVYQPKVEESLKKLYTEVRRVREISGGPEALKEISGVLERGGK